MKLQSVRLFVAAVACSLMLSKPTMFVKASEMMAKLHDHLLKNYHKLARPVLDERSSVVVNLTVYLTNLLDLNTKDQVLKTSGSLEMFWSDEYLRWNPDHFANITFVFLPQTDVWHPDVVIYNDVDGAEPLGTDRTLIVVQNDGIVSWQPSFSTSTNCTVDVYRYPLDTQTCSLIISSWMMTSEYVQFVIGSFNFTWASVNQEYDIVASYAHGYETDVSYSCDWIKGGNFTLVVKRRYKLHLLSTVVPLTAFSLLSPLTFLVPETGGDKTTLAVTVLLTNLVFLGALRDTMPSSGDSISLLVLYTEIQIMFSFLAVIVNALLLYIPNQSSATELDTTPRRTGHNGNSKDPVDRVIKMLRKRSTVTPVVPDHPAAAVSDVGPTDVDDVIVIKGDSALQLGIPSMARSMLCNKGQQQAIQSSNRSRDKWLFLISLFLVLMVDIVFGVLLAF